MGSTKEQTNNNMPEDKNTIDSILNAFRVMSEEKQPIDVHMWLEGCAKLTVLVSGVQEELFILQQKISQKKLEFIESGDSVAKAKVRIEASDEHLQARKVEAKIDQITELVRISKMQARMSDDNLKNYR